MKLWEMFAILKYGKIKVDFKILNDGESYTFNTDIECAFKFYRKEVLESEVTEILQDRIVCEVRELQPLSYFDYILKEEDDN
jgi:hypothetical protein